jgi:hypothetical protein
VAAKKKKINLKGQELMGLILSLTLSVECVGRRVLDLVINLQTSLSLTILLRLIRLGDGLSYNPKSSVQGHSGGSLVGSFSPGKTNESSVHVPIRNELNQVLESVFGTLVINLVNCGGLLGQGLDNSGLSGNG